MMAASNAMPVTVGDSTDVALAAAGDRQAFERLYRTHANRVYSLCARMSGSRSKGEELTQDVFVRTWEKLPQFRGESAFSTWLHRLAVNVVLMHFRQKGLLETSLEQTLEPQHEGEPRREFGANDIFLTGSIDRLTLENAIAGLPPGYRMVFVLHDVEGYEHNEIAEMLGCSIGNSKSQLHKARMKLRTFLSSLRPNASIVLAREGVQPEC